MISVFPLFPCPVLISPENYSFTEAEESYISELALADNLGNLMSLNDKILESMEMSSLKSFITEQLNIYTKRILRIREENEIYITQSWANTAGINQFHPRHIHPNSIISGVLFITGEEGDGLPPLRFHRGNNLIPLELQYEEPNDFNGGCHWFTPIRGRLLLFPSLIEHDVQENKTSKERVTISFNTFVRGELGNKAQLTQVQIN